jgi:hypothetical protein
VSVFKSTRLLGVSGLTLLFLLLPLAFITLFIFWMCVYLNCFLKGEISMCIPNQNYLIEALETVLTWNLADESLPDALVNQAKLQSGFDAEHVWQDFADMAQW